MAGIDDILSTVPLDQLAGRLGVDEATAQRAVGAALPALLAGLRALAPAPAGAASRAPSPTAGSRAATRRRTRPGARSW